MKKKKNNNFLKGNIDISNPRVKVILISLLAAFFLVFIISVVSIVKRANYNNLVKKNIPPVPNQRENVNVPMTSQEITRISNQMTAGQKDPMTEEEIEIIKAIMTGKTETIATEEITP